MESRALAAATKRFDKAFARDLCALVRDEKGPRGTWGYYLHNMKRVVLVTLGNGYCGMGVHDYDARQSYYVGVVKCSAARGV